MYEFVAFSDRKFDEKHRLSHLEEMPEKDLEETTESSGGSELDFSSGEDKVDVHDILPPARFTADKSFKPDETSTIFLNS